MQELLSQDRTFRLLYQFAPPPPPVREPADEGEQPRFSPDPRQEAMPSTREATLVGRSSSTREDELRNGGKRWREQQKGTKRRPRKSS
jgi:hypothetical protein